MECPCVELAVRLFSTDYSFEEPYPGFPKAKGGRQPTIWPKFHENWMKMKKMFLPEGGHTFLTP